MTNFNQAKSFTLHAEGTESYAWAWEGIDRQQALKEIVDTGNDIVAYADGWACELCNACIDQISPEGERGFTAEEITNDLIDDRHALADALQAWLEGEYDDQDGKKEPLYTITHPMMGDWSDPATIAEIASDVAMNWHDENIKYTVKVKWDKVVIYGMDYESNSRDWREWLDLGDGEYSLEIGELYQPEEEGDDEPEPQPFSEDEETSDETYLGESTLAKIRQHKELILGDREEMFPSRSRKPNTVTPDAEPKGFFICTESVQGRGKTPASMIYAFSDKVDFLDQNPQWVGVELPNPSWFGVVVLDTTLPLQGGFQLAWNGWHDAIVHAPFIY